MFEELTFVWQRAEVEDRSEVKLHEKIKKNQIKLKTRERGKTEEDPWLKAVYSIEGKWAQFELKNINNVNQQFKKCARNEEWWE